jgi:hypothetical protein
LGVTLSRCVHCLRVPRRLWGDDCGLCCARDIGRAMSVEIASSSNICLVAFNAL